jgi:NAD(P)-dependent dehydrogenase (short-subunit alcohol dehydrogenase family)
MTGKTCLVTGATDGIGRVAARVLAERGATVILVGRSADKTRRVVEEIKTQTGSASVDYLLADLSSLQQVRDLAAQFNAQYSRLDVLINNAGAMFMKRLTTADGLEMTFALNHLAYFLLTHLLLDTLKASAPARIINVSSGAHFGRTLNFDDLQYQRQRYSGFTAYGQSKLMNIYFTYELARRLEGTGISANTLHPGLVATQFAANNWGWFGRVIVRKLIDLASISAEKGALTTLHLATSPEVDGVSGQYFYQSRAVKSSAVSYDEAAQRRLWQISAEITGVGG